MDDYVCGFDCVLVDFGRKIWFWSILAEKVVLVDFDRKYWGLTDKTGFGWFWLKNSSWLILADKVVLVDFDWKTGL